VGVVDKKTVMSVVYKAKDTGQAWAKRFIVEKFILDKSYRYFDEKSELLYLSADPAPNVELQFAVKSGQKAKKQRFPLKDIPIKGAHVKGIRLATQKVKKVVESDQRFLF